MADPIKLRQYSRGQLIEELARRANSDTPKRPKQWCHDCANYRAWNEIERGRMVYLGDVPDDYNPCTKSHEMRFMAPEEIDDEWGFYLTVCADRNMLPAEEQDGY